MDAMYCFHCGLHHDKASMTIDRTRKGRKGYMCPKCSEKIQKNLNANPAVKKKYREGNTEKISARRKTF